MFYYKTCFSEKVVFSGKKCIKSFARGHPVLRGGGRLAIKINVTFFLGIEILSIFHFNNFFEKKLNK